MVKRGLGIIILVATFLQLAQGAYAVSAPSFPSCLNPQGTLIANYADGTHGIPGDTTAYSGSDKVYSYSGDQTLQCLCQVNGSGIQTNWLKVSSYPQEDIDALIQSGWIYIADGSAWGLDAAPYIAQNHAYSCLAIGGKDPAKKSKSSHRSSSRSSSSSTGGAVLGTSTVMGQVLGLASTGNSKTLYNMWLVGLLLLTLGVWLKWLKQQQLRKKS